MRVTKYTGIYPNWDLNGDGRYPTHKAIKKAERRYWRKQLLKKKYKLRCKVNLELEE